MDEEFALSVPVAILIGRSGFGDYLYTVKDDARKNIQEVISIYVVLIWNNAIICDGSRGEKIWVRNSYEMCKSLDINSSVVLSPLLFVGSILTPHC